VAAAPQKGDPWNDPRLPWYGKPRTADILCWLGIVLSGLFYWALLPLRVSLIGTHPVVAEVLNGSIESIISAAAFARVGHGTLAVVLLAAIPGLMKFDILYWWAGRLWGERFLMALPGNRRVVKNMERVRRSGRKFTWPAMLVSSFLPIPRAIIFVIVGWAGMRLVTFLVLDLIGVLLWASTLAGLGYALGHNAVVAAKTVSHYSLWFTIGIVALSVLLTVRSQRRSVAGPGTDG
jgi:membrane protein DedA with SNARE-associated domain